MATLDEVAMEEELIPITRQEEIMPPPPPLPQTAQLLDILNIVNDDVVLDEMLELVNEDVSQQAEVAILEVGPEVEEEAEATIFRYAEVMPSFPGGDAAMMKFIGENIKYPPLANDRGIQGRVFVSFIVGRDGSITDVKVAQSVDPMLDAEAVRVVKLMPIWKPGEHRGKPVRFSQSLPINFILN
jgi:protein TonB